MISDFSKFRAGGGGFQPPNFGRNFFSTKETIFGNFGAATLPFSGPYGGKKC